MLLRIPKRPPGSRRQRELKRTEGDKLQAGQGRAAQSREPQLRPRSTEEPSPPEASAAGPSRHRRPPFRKHREAAQTSAARLATPQKRWGPGRRELPQRQRRARARPAAVLPAGTPRGGPPVTSAKAPLPLGASSPAGDSRQTCEARATEEGRVARERPGSHRSHRSRYFYDTKKKITSISFLFPTSAL